MPEVSESAQNLSEQPDLSSLGDAALYQLATEYLRATREEGISEDERELRLADYQPYNEEIKRREVYVEMVGKIGDWLDGFTNGRADAARMSYAIHAGGEFVEVGDNLMNPLGFFSETGNPFCVDSHYIPRDAELLDLTTVRQIVDDSLSERGITVDNFVESVDTASRGSIMGASRSEIESAFLGTE